MCGISGFADPKLTAEEGRDLLEQMMRATKHRGPDASGMHINPPVFLGHNRLSIIDLSEDANQPLQFQNSFIVLNGEIYNYLELRQELTKKGFQFRTQSDTEVVVAAYQCWGEECVSRFIGMWAFVIYDTDKQILFASRDRFGIKPFYYLHSGKQFYFGSEYKTLKPAPVFKNDINVRQVMRGLQLGWVCYNDETYFCKLKALPAAHNLVYDLQSGSLTIDRYWDIRTGSYESATFREKKEHFLSLFTESLKLHLRSDVPVAGCLSGGIDSSAIASMIQQLNQGSQYHTFSIYYDGAGDVDERPFVHEVLKKYPSIISHSFTPSEKDITEHFHQAMYHAEVPVTGSSFFSQYFLMKLISEHHIKVVLDGQGSDEYLAGYMHTHYRMVADYIRSFRWREAIRHSRNVADSLQLNLFKQ